MAQKYKVYYNNKIIFITDEINLTAKASAYRLCHYPGVELREEWLSFSVNEEARYFYILGNPDEIWKVFKRLFVSIKAAGGLVKSGKGEYLFIFRNKKWDLPKGKMDKGEKWEETAIREVEEECGIKKLKIAEPIAKSYHIYMLKGKYALKQTCWFAMSCSDTRPPIPQNEEGIEKAVWVKPILFKKWKKEMYPSVWDIVKEIK